MKDYDTASSGHLSNEKNNDEVRRCARENQGDNHPTQEEMEDNPLWDGSETELIADDDALIYEEQQTGIKLEYTLKYEEILSCLKLISGSEEKTKSTIIKTVILFILAIGFIIEFAVLHSVMGLVLGILCIIMALAVKFVPSIIMSNTAREITTDKAMYVEVYPDNLVVGKNGVETEIPLDGSCKFKEFQNLFILFPEKGEMLAIPIRAIEPDFLADIQAILTAGTQPQD